jgi:hypothetical protein
VPLYAFMVYTIRHEVLPEDGARKAETCRRVLIIMFVYFIVYAF